MKNIEKYQKLLTGGEVDALLLTSKHNRMYAAEYCIAEGVAVICRTQSYYFTDFRYIEAAQKNLPGFVVRMTDAEHPYTQLINEAISDNTVKTLGFEDDSLTVEEYTLYNTKLNAVLQPYSEKINAPRQSKEPWEIEYMKKAQEITDRTFEDLLNVIHAGMTEKELCAELIYRLYKFGSEGPSFDPITISGPNTSLPHGVPSERVLQYGDFVTMDFGCLYHGYCSDMTFVRTKMKNVVTGAVTETSFNPTAKFEEAYIERKDYEYSYNDGDLYYFMDQETYDMVPVSKDMLDDSFKFIKENTPVKLLSYKGNIFSVETPNFVELTVTKADPGVKGDTATNVTKPATVETGAEIKVPLFINEGEKIQIDTRTGEYLGRVKG